MRYLTTSEEDTRALGAALGQALRPGDALLLRGELGAGKSVLARGAASALKVTDPMPSPTFTLMQPYEGIYPVYHFDLYRLADLDEFEAAGLYDYMDAEGVCLIEWPLTGLLPRARIEVDMRYGVSDSERCIEVDAANFQRAEALVGALKQWEEPV